MITFRTHWTTAQAMGLTAATSRDDGTVEIPRYLSVLSWYQAEPNDWEDEDMGHEREDVHNVLLQRLTTGGTTPLKFGPLTLNLPNP